MKPWNKMKWQKANAILANKPFEDLFAEARTRRAPEAWPLGVYLAKKGVPMSGFDRAVLMEQLIALGWREAPAGVECDSLSHSCLVPPDSLWENKPKKAFYVYEARDLQNLLGKSVPEDDDTPKQERPADACYCCHDGNCQEGCRCWQSLPKVSIHAPREGSDD